MGAPSAGEARADARGMLRAAVEAAEPGPLVEAHLEVGDDGVEVAGEVVDPGAVRCAALGKAAPGMARALAGAFPEAPGVCAAPGRVLEADGPGPVPAGWRAVAGGHPLPDEGSRAAGEALLEAAGAVRAGGALVVGVSGGGSACAEVPRVPLGDLRWVTGGLLEAGTGIGDLNAVRRALSDLKGGGLARACAGRVVGLVLSDVVGDDLADVASGPTVPVPSAPARARDVLEEAGLWAGAPEAVRRELAGDEPEAVTGGGCDWGGGGPDGPETGAGGGGVRGGGGPAGAEAGGVVNRLVGGNRVARRGAVAAAEARGYVVRERDRPLVGEAREVGRDLVREARELRGEAGGSLVLVAGGEATVTVTGGGVGGPCQELLLGAARACAGEETVVGAVATDGVDGPSGAAGGLVDGGTVGRAASAGRDVEAALAENDAGGLLEEVEGRLRPGPTGANVNDVAVVLVP